MNFQIESRNLPTEIGDFSSVSPSLRVVLYPGKEWNIKLASLLHAVPNVCAMVVIDSPESVMWLPRTQLVKWKKELPEVFEIALENTIQSAKPELIKYPYRDTELVSLSGDIFTVTLILGLRSIPGVFGKYGSLVSMYGQDRLLIYKIQDEGVIQDLQYFVFMHIDILKDEKAIVSPAVFWCSDYIIREVEYRITKKRKIKCDLPKQLKQQLRK